MKHLRFLGLAVFLILLPAGIALYAVDLLLGYVQETRDAEAFYRMGDALKEVDRRAMLGRDRLRLVSEAAGAITALPDLSDASVDRVRADFEARRPGLLRIVVARHVWKDDRYELAGGADLAKRTLYLNLFRILVAHPAIPDEDRNNGGPITGGMRAMVARGLFDQSPGFLETLPFHRQEMSACKSDGRPAALYLDWFAVPPSPAPQLFNCGLVVVLVFDDKYAEYCSDERVLAETIERMPPADFALGRSGAGTAEAALFSGDDPAVAAAFRQPPRGRIDVTGRDRLYAFLPSSLGDGRSILLRAVMDRAVPFPTRGAWTRLAWSVTALSAAALLVLLGLVHYGSLVVYLPVRVQLVGLFLFATSLPLAGAFVLALQFVRADREGLVRAKYEEIATRVADLDARAILSLDRLRYAALDATKNDATPAALAFLAANPAAEGDPTTSDEVRLRWFSDLDRKLDRRRQDDYFDDYFIYDAAGRIVWMKDRGGPAPLEGTFLRILARMVVKQYNSGKVSDNPSTRNEDAVGKDMMTGLIMQEQGGIAEDIVRTRGRIHNVKILKYDVALFCEPIVDPQGMAVGVFCVTFDREKIMPRFAAEAVQESRAGGGGIRLVAGHARAGGPGRRFPDAAAFDDPLEAFLQRIVKENAPQQGEFMSKGERVIAAGMPLKEITDHVMIGLYPRSEIERVVFGRQLLIGLGFLLSLIAAATIGTLLARRFLAPVRRLEVGVRAVSAGDFDVRTGIESADEFGDLSRTFDQMVTGLKEKARMSRYVSEFVLSEVQKEDAGESLGVTRKVTVLFSDIRGFTTHSENHPPEAIVRLLNAYFEAMTAVIRGHGGVIDKFIGDAIMAVFYPDFPPGAGPDEPRAVRCALAMRAALARFNAGRAAAGLFTVDNGIGLNTGDVIQGNIGARDIRVDHTVIGDNVNLASRLESLSKTGRHTKIILSEETLAAVADWVEVEPLATTSVKGKSREVLMFEIVRAREGPVA